MNDKSLESLRYYDIHVGRVAKGRGGAYIYAQEGCKLFLECTKNDGFYIRDAAVTEAVKQAGFKNVDTYVKNVDGDLFTVGEDGRKYVMKNWFDARECDVNSPSDVIESVRALARLHMCLDEVASVGISIEAPVSGRSVVRRWESMAAAEEDEETDDCGTENEAVQTAELRASESCVVPLKLHTRAKSEIRENLKRHAKELKKAANYMKSKKRKNEFEQIALGAANDFCEEARVAAEYVNSETFDERFARMASTGELAHGSFNYHNVFLGAGEARVAVTNFERCRNDCQITDLYQFLRKVMEKHNWNSDIAYGMIDEYDRVKPIADEDLDMLAALLRFPEKFWKIINQYYNAGKAWVPTKNIDKLKLVIGQNGLRRELIDKICGL